MNEYDWMTVEACASHWMQAFTCKPVKNRGKEGIYVDIKSVDSREMLMTLYCWGKIKNWLTIDISRCHLCNVYIDADAEMKVCCVQLEGQI